MIRDDDELDYERYYRKERQQYLVKTYHILEWAILFGLKDLKGFRL